MIDKIEEQAADAGAFRKAVYEILAEQWRAAALETFFIALFFLVAGALITLATVAFLGIFVTVFFWRNLRVYGLTSLRAGGCALLIFSAIRIRTILASEMAPKRFSVWDTISADNFGPWSVDLISSVILIGPRCLALAGYEIRDLWKLYEVDLHKLVDPIEVAFFRRKKVTQRDLGEINLVKFLNEIAWFKGIVRLYAPPPGFVLSDRFRGRLRAWRIPNPPPEEPQPQADYQYQYQQRRKQRVEEPVEEIDEDAREKAWALSVLGLSGKPTRDEIKRAYRRLAKQYHPDLRRGGSDAKMKDLNRAMEIMERLT